MTFTEFSVLSLSLIIYPLSWNIFLNFYIGSDRRLKQITGKTLAIILC